MIDSLDLEIIDLLMKDSRIQLKEIGEKIHLSGQAIGVRIRKLEEAGIIEGFTIKINKAKIQDFIEAYITLFMNSSNHKEFREFILESKCVKEVHRISGRGCYILKINVANQEEMTSFLDDVLKYANYQVNISIEKIK